MAATCLALPARLLRYLEAFELTKQRSPAAGHALQLALAGWVTQQVLRAGSVSFAQGMRTRSLPRASAHACVELAAPAGSNALPRGRQAAAAAMPPSAGLSAVPVSAPQSANEQLLAAAGRRPARKADRPARHSEAAGMVPNKSVPEAAEVDAAVAVAAAAAADALAMPPPAQRKRRCMQRTPQDTEPQQQEQEQLQQANRLSLTMDEAMPEAVAADAMALSLAAFQAATATAPIAAASLGTLAPSPIPLFVTPADGVMTRRRKPALVAPATRPAPGAAAAAPHNFVSFAGVPAAAALLRFLPRGGTAGGSSYDSGASRGGSLIGGQPSSSLRNGIRGVAAPESTAAMPNLCEDDICSLAEPHPAGMCAAAEQQREPSQSPPQPPLQAEPPMQSEPQQQQQLPEERQPQHQQMGLKPAIRTRPPAASSRRKR